jgi:hypothetical protein
MTLEKIETELAELARLATLSESFDEDRAQYLLDMQTRLIERGRNPPPDLLPEGGSHSLDENDEANSKALHNINLATVQEDVDYATHDSRDHNGSSNGNSNSSGAAEAMNYDDDEKFQLLSRYLLGNLLVVELFYPIGGKVSAVVLVMVVLLHSDR